MDEKNRMIFALVSGVITLAVSITVAYIAFKILGSSAEASLQNWKLGGAFAGFVFTASLLTSITFQFYKQLTVDQIGKYREQIQELQAKLIKGAPRPQGYTIDIDERHKLVFARPRDWLPKEGLLYQYVEKKPLGVFPANFNVVFQRDEDIADTYEQFKLGTFDAANVDIERLYEDMTNFSVDILKSSLPSFENLSLSKEFILVDDIKSLKWIISYTTVHPNQEEKKIRFCQSAIYIYAPRLGGLYNFNFTDIEEHYLKASEVLNNVIRSIRFL